MSVLLAHYEAREGQRLAEALEEASFRVVHVESEPVQATAVEASGFDIVILGAEGLVEERLASCRRLRAEGYLGAIVGVSAHSGEAARFLDTGADDFAIAPIDAPEMVLRARVALGRVVTHARVRWASLEIDRVHRTAHLRDRPLSVTAREYALLLCLVEAAGKAVSRADLLSKVWGIDADRGSNLVEVHLSRLRDKLGADSKMIETVRRAGYRLRR